MIVVIGTALARPDTLDEMRRLSVEHVERSRLEAGCLSHEVAIDVLRPLQLSFTERWDDAAALAAHFQLDASRRFAKALAALAAEAPQMTLYVADAVTPAQLLAQARPAGR
jgi:quinol monooxygenase YgiN